tara:strand:+ start:906 stop:1118 length:213 start_codon:yes stop_codon:yes gene_type:complete
MSRCKACDSELAPLYLNKTDKEGVSLQEEEDLCSPCRGASYSKYNILSDKEYQFEGLETEYSELIQNTFN